MAIELRNIYKRFNNITALNDVSLVVHDGEFITLLGPSGCGKTTLLRIIAGFVQPDEGEILLDGERVNHLPANLRSTGMVFQSYALFPHMTVERNIAFGLRVRGTPKSKIQEKVSEVAALVDIESMLNRYPSQLSGGQQQRVALARTLAIEPSVLLLDEPLAALDRKLRVEMRTDVRKLIKKLGITTIFVTHDQEEALTMSDRIAVMDHGLVMQVGSPMHIYDRPKTPFVATFVGNSNIFQGTVKRDDKQRLIFEADGLLLPLPSTFSECELDRISLLLRPEHIDLGPLKSENDKDALAVAGTITFATHLGVSIEYEVMLDTGAQLKLEVKRSRDESPLAVGTRVWVKPVDNASYLMISIDKG